jgi:hypothetical protein
MTFRLFKRLCKLAGFKAGRIRKKEQRKRGQRRQLQRNLPDAPKPHYARTWFVYDHAGRRLMEVWPDNDEMPLCRIARPQGAYNYCIIEALADLAARAKGQAVDWANSVNGGICE